MANNGNYFRLAGSSMGVGADALANAFGPDTQFGVRIPGQGVLDISKLGDFGQAAFILQQRPSQAEEFAKMAPLVKEMTAYQAELANKNAQRKFGQELMAAGIGALGRGIETGIAGGSPEMLAYIAQGPVRAAEAYQRGITSIPRQDVPVFAARPTPDRRYFS